MPPKIYYSEPEPTGEPPAPPIIEEPKIDPTLLAAQQAQMAAQQAQMAAQIAMQQRPQESSKKVYEDPNWLKDPNLFKKGLGEMIKEHTEPLEKRNRELEQALTNIYATSAQDPNAERTRSKATELAQKYNIPHGTAMIMAREQFGSVPQTKPTPPRSATSPDSKASTKSSDSETERFSDYDVPIVKGEGKDFKSIIKELRKSGKFA